jgi:glycerophosphoryl diester phosphodiesterase
VGAAVKDDWRMVLGVARVGWRRAPQLVAYAVVFKLLTLAVLGPLSAAVLAGLIAATGSYRYAVGNEDLVSFFLSVPGVLAALVWGSLALFSVGLAQAGPILIGSEWLQGRHLSFAAAWARVLWRTPDLLRLGLCWVAVWLGAALPFLGLAALAYFGLWSRHDLNYLFEERPPAFWAGAAVVGILALGYAGVALWLTLRWALALPACLLGGLRPRPALRASAALTRGQLLRLALLRTAGLALALALTGLALGCLYLLGRALLPWAGASLNRAVPVVVSLLMLNALAVGALAFLAATADALLILHVYREVVGRPGEATVAALAPVGAAADPPPGWVSSRTALTGGTAVVGLLGGVVSLGIVHGLEVKEPVAITAHRCGARHGPENTVAALRKSIAAGADYAELDVQETADGVVVVLHDTDLFRVAGDKRKIWQIRFADLRRLDVGSRFGFPPERVPTLEEVIDAAGDEIKLNIELKFTKHTRKLVERVLEIVARKEFASRCVLTSLSEKGLRQVRRANPDVKIGYIVTEAVGDPTRLDVDFLSVRHTLATEEFVARARKHGKEVHAWTVNDPRRLRRLVDHGVANVITDDPAALIEERKRLEQMSVAERLVLKYRGAPAR